MNTITKALTGAVITLGVGVGTVLGTAATVQASPAGYLTSLIQDGGITVYDPAQVLRDGHNICGALANGYSMEEVIAATKNDNPELTWYGAGFAVGAAIRHLC
jgi:hypothetical protein